VDPPPSEPINIVAVAQVQEVKDQASDLLDVFASDHERSFSVEGADPCKRLKLSSDRGEPFFDVPLDLLSYEYSESCFSGLSPPLSVS
jgi:hypothetical protein